MFLHLDVSKAQATNQEDLRRILAEIENDVGVTPMTHDLKDALVDSVVAEVREGGPSAALGKEGGKYCARSQRGCRAAVQRRFKARR